MVPPADMPDKDWTSEFRKVFASGSSVEVRISHIVDGDEYPAELEPYSFVTRSELRRVAAEVQVGAGDHVVDVACGSGGPGLWVAATTGSRLIGIDIADTALDAARRRAEVMGLGPLVEYRIGSFDDTGLAAASASAAMSVDALMFAPDKERAIRELARVLRPGGRLVFTSWDFHEQPIDRPPQVDDHRPLLEAAGFRVLAYEDTPLWRERLQRYCELLLASVDELAYESEESSDVVRARAVVMKKNIDCMTRRLLAVALRT